MHTLLGMHARHARWSDADAVEELRRGLRADAAADRRSSSSGSSRWWSRRAGRRYGGCLDYLNLRSGLLLLLIIIIVVLGVISLVVVRVLDLSSSTGWRRG